MQRTLIPDDHVVEALPADGVEPATVPAHDRVRRHDPGRPPPVWPQPGEPDPQQAVSLAKPRALWRLALEDGELEDGQVDFGCRRRYSHPQLRRWTRTGDSGMGEVVGIAALALFCHMTAAFFVSLGWTGAIGPLTILFLILRVSGIPMLEAKFRRNPEFEDDLARTSAFFPWFPARRGAGR